jgi:hypothetical protein
MAGPGQPLFTGYTLGTLQNQATAAGPLAVIGSGYPSVYQMGIGWTDTCSGTLSGSDVEWGPEGGASMVTHLLASANRQFTPFAPVPGLVAFDGSQPQPGPYVFRARNSDDDPSLPLTTTQFSEPVTVWSAGDVVLLLAYQSRGPILLHGLGTPAGTPAVPAPQQPLTGVVVGTPVIQRDGTFSQQIIIPPDALPGPATLCAQLLGQRVACVPIQIVAQVGPLIRVVNPTTMATLPDTEDDPYAVYPGSAIPIAGEGFNPAGQVSFFADEPQGTVLGQTLVGAPGTFLYNLAWPGTTPGLHTLYAVETIAGKTIQATLFLAEQFPLG